MESVEKRWGEGAVDLEAWSLPALKIRRAFESLPTQNPRRVLDYGCGEGKLLQTLHLHYPEVALTGTDIQIPKQTLSDFSFRSLAEMEKDPAVAGSFDLVFSVDVLEHVDNLEHTLRFCSRALRSGGLFVGFMPAEGHLLSPYSLFRLLLGRDLYARTKDHKHPYRRGEIRAALGRHFQLETFSYSYHFLGSWMDAAFFAACAHPALSKWWWEKNTVYRPTEKKGILGKLLDFANRVVFWEATLARQIPFGAAGVHFVCRKK